MDPSVAGVVRASARLARGLGGPVVVDAPCGPEGILPVAGRALRILHAPGHSPSDIVLADPAGHVAFTGDVLVARVPSTTVVARPLDPRWDGRRPRPLVTYRRSLHALLDLDFSLALPGHGPAFAGWREIVRERLAAQDRLAAQLLEELRPATATAYELGVRLHPAMATGHVYNGLSETLGLLDLLVADGTAVEHPAENDQPVRFSVA